MNGLSVRRKKKMAYKKQERVYPNVNKIKKLMKEKKITIEEMAERTFYTPRTIRKILANTGKPKIACVIESIAKEVGAELKDVVIEKKEEKKKNDTPPAEK